MRAKALGFCTVDCPKRLIFSTRAPWLQYCESFILPPAAATPADAIP